MTAWRVDQAELRDMVKACAADREMPARVLAVALDVKTEVVHALLAGNRQWWLEAVETMADLFEMSVEELVGDGVTPKRRADIKRGRTAAPVPLTKEVPGKVRALCCTCGTMKRIKRADLLRDEMDLRDRQVVVGETFASDYTHGLRLAGRAMYPTECTTCKVVTPHALLRDHWKRDRDFAETYIQRPSADDKARIERDALVRRMEGFGVDIHWRLITSKKRAKKGHLQPTLSLEFDESKSRWRVEVSTGYPPTVQLPAIKEAWEVIALDRTEWWARFDGNPTEGAWMFPQQEEMSSAVEGLIDEIHNAAPAVLTSIMLGIDDREVNS